MLSNRLAVAALGLACMTAAGVGGYLATRQNATVPVAVSASEGTTAAAESSGLESLPPVEETEAAIAPASSQSRPAKRPAVAEPPRTQRSSTKPAAPTVARAEPVPPAPASQQPSAPPASVEPAAAPATAVDQLPPAAPPRAEEVVAPEPKPSAPPVPTHEELVVSADSVIGFKIETSLSSERARVEDRVDAQVVRDVRVGGLVAVPAGSRAIGSVMVVERGGKMKDRARLGIRFHTLVLADGTRLPITTETIYRTGDAPGNASAAKIGGGAAVGAILGAIIGGGKGAAIGGSIGAGAGTTSVMTGDRSTATFAPGTEVNARVLAPVTVTIERQ